MGGHGFAWGLDSLVGEASVIVERAVTVAPPRPDGPGLLPKDLILDVVRAEPAQVAGLIATAVTTYQETRVHARRPSPQPAWRQQQLTTTLSAGNTSGPNLTIGGVITNPFTQPF